MKQKFFFIQVGFILVMILSSCIFTGPSVRGNGDVKEEIRNTGDFDEIKVSRGMNVYISQGNESSVIVKADENLLDAIETNVEGGILKVTTNSNIRKATELKVMVTVSELNAVKTTAGSNVFSENTFETNEIDLSATAGSNMKMNLEVKSVDVSASAGSNIKLSGSAKSINCSASSGSNIKAEEFTSTECVARVSSGANIWIIAKNDFKGRASSGGNIFYYGNPATTDIQKSSGGNVIKK